MTDPIRVPGIGLQPVEAGAKVMRVPQPAPLKTSGPSFHEVLTNAVTEVQRLQNEADATIQQLVSGEIKDVAQAMVAVEKADVAFQTMMAVRNKMVAAYEEIMRMQV
ncbi:MAG TPA: flagellar hook-basal body complex protein FliE [Candidatus Hydrogenedentes bacterium]|nr:flagellar hook-basal body complex protein FliE [Candidatus Hydrogenedentota bacterium]HPG67891.1 flagellar hook-basal body complex protein FliE [Candidatus Hydrogenedentota bacterium]